MAIYDMNRTIRKVWIIITCASNSILRPHTKIRTDSLIKKKYIDVLLYETVKVFVHHPLRDMFKRYCCGSVVSLYCTNDVLALSGYNKPFFLKITSCCLPDTHTLSDSFLYWMPTNKCYMLLIFFLSLFLK